MFILGLALLVGLFVILLRNFIALVARRATLRAKNDPASAGADLVVPALMESGGSGQIGQGNGNGVLAVFPHEVRFVLGVPRRTITIRRADITAAKVTKTLRLRGIRRAGGPPFLIIEWRSPEGTFTTGFQTTHADRVLAELHVPDRQHRQTDPGG